MDRLEEIQPHLHDPPQHYAEALKLMRNKPYVYGPAHQQQQWRAVRMGAHPHIVTFERHFIRRLARLDIPMFGHNMVRTRAHQSRLFVKGVSKAGPGKSPHNFGCAVDIVHANLAWDIPDFAWTILGHIGKEVAGQQGFDITWGGDFKSIYDPAHWELTNWRKLKDEYPFPGEQKLARANLDDFS